MASRTSCFVETLSITPIFTPLNLWGLLVPEKGGNPGFPPPDEPPWKMEKMMFFQQTGLRELHEINFKNYPLFVEGLKHTVVSASNGESRICDTLLHFSGMFVKTHLF